MKKTFLLLIAFTAFGFLANISAQEKTISHATSDISSILPSTTGDTTVWKQLGFAYEKQKKYSSSIEVYENTVVQVAYSELEIVEVKVTFKGKPLRVSPTRIAERGNIFAKYAVVGHPEGPCSLYFADVDDDNDGAAQEGRQKNRRVEMKIEFE